MLVYHSSTKASQVYIQPVQRKTQEYRRDSISPISIVLYLKLTSTMIQKELYSIEKCAICLDTFKILELIVCRIIKITKKVYMSVKNMPLTDEKRCMSSKLCLGSI